MKIVAFLQNLWVKNPAKVAAIFARRAGVEGFREDFLRRLLFAGGKTGRVLQTVFGADLCEQIVWEESTPEIGGDSRAVFPPDTAHIIDVLKKHRPEIVLAFGQIASGGVFHALQRLTFSGDRARFQSELITGPHPAAIGAEHMTRLREIRGILDQRLGLTRIPPISANSRNSRQVPARSAKARGGLTT